MSSKKIGLQLMLIDPDDDLRFLLKILLELTGCTVQSARNVAEAFALAKANPPDIIFTELLMQDVDGLAFGRQFRSAPWAIDTLLVALTGRYYPGIARDAQDNGFERYLLKPVQFDQIMTILKLVAKKRRRSVYNFPQRL